MTVVDDMTRPVKSTDQMKRASDYCFIHGATPNI